MDIDPRLIQKYYTDSCPDEERQLVENWLKAGAPDKDHPSGCINKDTFREDLWKSIKTKTGLESRKAIHSRALRNRRTFVVAASVTLIMFIISLFIKTDHRKTGIAYKEIRVPYGKKVTVTLKDSSVILLNSGSAVRFPEKFDDTVRKVYLKGEAYFSVSRDKRRPFIVETGRSQTRVLGTKFNLRDFESETSARITLKEGHVVFSKKGENEIACLSPGYQATLTGGKLTKTPVDADSFTGWMNGDLNFDNIPLSEAMAEIERVYAVNTIITNRELAKLKIKGSFRRLAVERLMEELSFLLNTRYKIQQNNITIYK